jgi:hypothetical protein
MISPSFTNRKNHPKAVADYFTQGVNENSDDDTGMRPQEFML